MKNTWKVWEMIATVNANPLYILHAPAMGVGIMLMAACFKGVNYG